MDDYWEKVKRESEKSREEKTRRTREENRRIFGPCFKVDKIIRGQSAQKGREKYNKRLHGKLVLCSRCKIHLPLSRYTVDWRGKAAVRCRKCQKKVDLIQAKIRSPRKPCRGGWDKRGKFSLAQKSRKCENLVQKRAPIPYCKSCFEQMNVNQRVSVFSRWAAR